ncbi:MAG: DsbA family protein [Acidobacteria bacterium]|nr:DsbA family protein [Acidobacteriota bacterium]
MSRNPKQSKSSLPFIIIGAVLAAVVVAVVLMSRRGGDETPPAPQNNSNFSPVQQTRAPQPGAPNPWAKGGAAAKLTLEEFSDFQCPACGGLAPGLSRVAKDYGDRIRVVFRHFPLAMHKYAFQASRAAEAAGRQGKFWEMHDMLYANQDEWKDAMEPRVQFDSYATRLGLDVQKFKTDMERPDLTERVKADYARGMSLGVKGTPTIYLNGRELVPGRLVTEEDLRREIDAALGSTGK